ncbi:MAG: hypothetical protein CMQ05_11440 [Gammaproteobacteria bacterium]|nr:hypothetical protein [Gammaproteobacteria bacterium]RPG24636.1 MAG: hypothetical protein CBC10_010945 [Gammaproteobacteria bacterium TMED50]
MDGFVELHFIVGVDSKPYEISVQDPTNPRSELSAIKAIRKFVFEPANFEGVPLDAGQTFRMNYAMHGGVPARPLFRKPYQDLLKAVNEQDPERARSHLNRMLDIEIHNNAEYFLVHFSRFLFAEAWGTREEQLDALTHAMRQMKFDNNVKQEVYENSLLKLFVLQTELKDFSGALQPFETIKESNMPEEKMLNPFAPLTRTKHLRPKCELHLYPQRLGG